MKTVKNKIRWGTVFLFLLVVLASGFSIFYLVQLKQQTQNIIGANYESLEFVHTMQMALDSIEKGNRNYLDSFHLQLVLQENNITEPGEKEVTRSLRKSFENMIKDTAVFTSMRYHLQQILSLNMTAIRNKSRASGNAAENATTYLITVVSIILLIGFTFAINFPSFITDPIRRLTEAIREIGVKNYGHRIHIDSKDEFGELAGAFNEMAERLEYFETSNLNKIIFEKKRAEAVINSLKDASIGIDKAEVILFANDQALQLLGLPAKDVVGQKTPDVSKRNDLFRYLLEEKGTVPFKIVVDNKENFFIKEVIEVGETSDNSRVIVLKNITSFKELDVAKTNFIATISHELKTPLASSDFSLKLLEDERVGELSAEQRELIENLKKDNQRMIRILSELLNMSQVESGKIKLNNQQVNPYEIIEASIAAVQSLAIEKNLVIQKKLDKGLPELTADGNRIIWVLNNYLTNAIKYSPQGSQVVLDVQIKIGGLSFSVADRGEGIEERYLERIFERYFQVPGRSDVKGSGIGLAICKEFIEAMGGTVWVKSQLGQGSEFGFVLPVV